uniref:NCK-associated protein 5-like n=1 Tax=Paramormyrops kingsleyae TaxID=1676925 RepID=A0A3B3RBN5_9TELE|nr:nck-associated protein 5-like isoform X1 [Paramormyrops kingsleyae]
MMSDETKMCDESFGSEEGDAEPFLEEGENTRELLGRLRELEAENSALALANESQREAYERCLDEVANHVVQALLNQKDLREECIKLKVRVFDLERQNRALSELLNQKLHSELSPHQQASSGPQLEPGPDPLLAGTNRQPESQHETATKSDGEHTRGNTPGAQGLAVSMEALSPFFKKKAHILEVLRRLEETDPLKFYPGGGLPSCCHFTPALVPAGATITSHLCLDTNASAVMNGEGHGTPHESCQSCLMLSQRNVDVGAKVHQVRGTSQPRAEEQLDGQGDSGSQATDPPSGSTTKPCMHSTPAEESGLPTDPSHTVSTDAYLYSIIKDAAQKHPSSETPEGGEPSEERYCDKHSGVALSMPCTSQANELDSLPLKHIGAVAIQSLATGQIAEGYCFKLASEVAKVKNYLYTSTSYQPVPGVIDHQARVQICNRLHLASNEDPSLRNLAVADCGPVPDNSTVQQPSPGKVSVALGPTSISCLSEAKASPISSPSRLLRFLKIPSMGERAQVASPLRLSPQLTRSSKIPCRNNTYEIYHSAVVSRQATSTERETQSSSSKTNTYPATHSAPASPPKDACLSVAKNYVFNSHSAPKASCSAKLKPAQRNIQKQPHYENVSGHSAAGVPQHLERMNISHFPPYPGHSDAPDTQPSSSTELSSGLQSSSRDTYAESALWYQAQSHHSLPNSLVFQKAQSGCVFSGVREKTPDRYAPRGPDVIRASDSPKRGDSPSVSKKQMVAKSEGDSCHLLFKERLAALGKLRSTDDLPVNPRAVDRRHARCSGGKVSGASINEKSRTAERQGDRTPSEHKHTKYTGSLDGKSYPKANLSSYALKSPGTCLPCEPGAKSLPLGSVAAKTEIEMSSSRVHATKLKGGMPSSSTEPPHVLRNYVKCVPSHSTRTTPSPQSSPAKVSSKSPSRPGQASSYPRGSKPAHDDRGSSQKQASRPEDRGKLTGSKKRSAVYAEGHPASPARQYVPGPRSAIEQKVMKGIEENMLKLQEQDRGQGAEAKQKASNGIASWFGLRKSKLPALSRKPDTSKPKEGKLSASSMGKDPKAATKKKLEVESLNISKLMEKAEDLRRALEEERALMNGVALDRPGRGHSCEVVMDQAQGQLSVMYRGVTSDNFMQQLLNRVDERDTSHFGLAHRRLSFDSKKSRPLFIHHRSGGIPHTKSNEDMEKGSGMVRKGEITSEESLAESVTSQHFAGSAASTHTLDSGIGTFPLPDYTGSALGIPRVKPHQERDTPRPGTKASRRTRTLELSALEEAPPRDAEQNRETLYAAALEEKATAAPLSCTITGDDSTDDAFGAQVASLPSKNWTFPSVKAPAGQAEVYLGVGEEVQLASHGSPFRQILKPSGPPAPTEAESQSLSLPPQQAQGRRAKGRAPSSPEVAKEVGLELGNERPDGVTSASQPQVLETPESPSDSLYDSLSSCGSQG